MKKDILSINCPSCGAPAEFDIVHQIYKCQFCSGKVGLEDAREEKEKYQSEIRKRAIIKAKDFSLMITSCSGCGAKLVFEAGEATSDCDFCGRKLVREKYTHKNIVPEAIIPFAVTKDEAKEKLSDWCKNNKSKREARHILKKANDIKGYYLPYQMARGPVYCDVNRKHESVKFAARGYLNTEFVNCSKQLDNLVLDAMEPYDLTELKEFEYSYVAGQRVKIPDISVEDAKDRLKEEVGENYRVYMEKIWGTKAIEMDTRVSTVLRSNVLLPVYYIKDGEVSAAVNGQTGKVSVRAEKVSSYIALPWWLEAILLFIVTCLTVFGVGLLVSDNLEQTLVITGILGAFYLFVFCFMFEPGLDNTGSITHYRNIYTSGDSNFRREKGVLVPRNDVLKRKIAEPVFFKDVTINRKEQKIPVTYVFRSKARIARMIGMTVGVVMLPVIVALFVNGFNFAQIHLGGSAVWFCITLPTAPIVLIQLGLKELYNKPLVYTIREDGKKMRYRPETAKTPIKDIILLIIGLCFHPLGFFALVCFITMVYLTAFGF